MGLRISISMGLVGVLGLLYLGVTVGRGGWVMRSNSTSSPFIAVPLFVS
jgi:hypothetical protein